MILKHSHISKVEHWLEELHNRRVEVTKMFTVSKNSLQQGLYLARYDDELLKLESLISEKKNQLQHCNSYGSSSSSAEDLLQSLFLLKQEADGISERCIDIAKHIEVRITCILSTPGILRQHLNHYGFFIQRDFYFFRIPTTVAQNWVMHQRN